MSAMIYETWDCCVNERGTDGKRHYWNVTVDARDARDAADQALGSFDESRVDGVEVERRGTDYEWAGDVAASVGGGGQ